MEPVDLLKDYEGKLVIDWGGSARMWHQKATTEKPIVAIESKNQKPFAGFEQLILSFDDLKEVKMIRTMNCGMRPCLLSTQFI